ncbi:hypothetical protein ACFXKR_40610, partial [Streptomyces violascens]
MQFTRERSELVTAPRSGAVLCSARSAEGPAPLASWCIGMGDDGASGWPGSDWIEDLILQTAGPVLYERWATGALKWTDAPVVNAWS